MDSQALADTLVAQLERFDAKVELAFDEVTVVTPKSKLLELCLFLRDDDSLRFEQLIDLCGVDYLDYGNADWKTESATSTGYSRGVAKSVTEGKTRYEHSHRFAVVYHLLSVTHNQRLRLKVYLTEQQPALDSVVGIWSAANWYEREAFDLYGILFAGHPDLRRLLTDYGFIGHPFRKDFPLIGEVEVRFDHDEQRVVYEPVAIEPRTLVPRVIRNDSRYESANNQADAAAVEE